MQQLTPKPQYVLARKHQKGYYQTIWMEKDEYTGTKYYVKEGEPHKHQLKPTFIEALKQLAEYYKSNYINPDLFILEYPSMRPIFISEIVKDYRVHKFVPMEYSELIALLGGD